MKILVDLLYIDNPEPSGIKKYGFKLLLDFRKYASQIELGVLCTSQMLEFIQSNIGDNYRFLPIEKSEFNKMRNGYDGFRKKYTRKSSIIESYDFIISTCANYPTVLFSPYIKHVGVIHDLQMIQLLKKSKNVFRSIFQFFDIKRKIKRLDYIITISKNTSCAVKKFTNKDSHVIYYALEPPTKNEFKPKHFPFSESEKYILDVNTFYRYKNADVLLEAFAVIHEQFPNYRLYFKGNYCKEFDRLPKIASELGIEDKVYFDLNHLSEDEMSWLYSNASLFVSPSLMEGFGATPIEAITHNTPVLVSNIDTLKEVVRDCATFFDPSNVTDLVENLTESINNQISQAELDKRKQFMLDVYSRKSQVMNYLNFLTSLN